VGGGGGDGGGGVGLVEEVLGACISGLGNEVKRGRGGVVKG
jgi:hypothetical protein